MTAAAHWNSRPRSSIFGLRLDFFFWVTVFFLIKNLEMSRYGLWGGDLSLSNAPKIIKIHLCISEISSNEWNYPLSVTYSLLLQSEYIARIIYGFAKNMSFFRKVTIIRKTVYDRPHSGMSQCLVHCNKTNEKHYISTERLRHFVLAPRSSSPGRFGRIPITI